MNQEAELTPETIARLLRPYVEDAPSGPDWQRIHTQLAVYLELILKWNSRTNLTAIRTPEEIVCRHFGESLFAGLHLGDCTTLLDFGSGAGFPGIPIQLLRPEVKVTLGESQGKKASFLREVVRTLDLPTEVWAARVEDMPTSRHFEVVTLRAVDGMDAAVSEALIRADARVLILGTRKSCDAAFSSRFRSVEQFALPGSTDGVLIVGRKD